MESYDPWGTRDLNLWKEAWTEYKLNIIDRLVDSKTSRLRNQVLSEFVDTVLKIYAFERATGHSLLSYIGTNGRLKQNRSFFALLMQ